MQITLLEVFYWKTTSCQIWLEVVYQVLTFYLAFWGYGLSWKCPINYTRKVKIGGFPPTNQNILCLLHRFIFDIEIITVDSCSEDKNLSSHWLEQKFRKSLFLVLLLWYQQLYPINHEKLLLTSPSYYFNAICIIKIKKHQL